MFHALGTILPIFSIILLGYFLKIRGIIHSGYAKAANQIVFYVAIPAMLFNEIAQAPFRGNFHAAAVLCLLGGLAILLVCALVWAKALGVPRSRCGTFLQCSFHGNLGYMAYAIAYYALGKEEFAKTAILSSFLMVAQNLLAVWALTTFAAERSGSKRERGWALLKHILNNPIILSVVASMGYSALNLPVPSPIARGLSILSGMALPTALLLIGAGLSFGTFGAMAKEIIGIGVLKLFCLPLLGTLLMALANVPNSLLLPGIILLAAPPATVTYVMATELGGEPELAATSISLLTLSSAFSYSLILSVFMTAP